MPGRELLHRPVRLIDGDIRVRGSPRIRISDRDLSKLPASHDPGLFAFGPLWIEQGIAFVRITVRPAIYRDALDVTRGIESSRAQHSRQLIADILFESGEGRHHQFLAPGTKLVALRNAWLAGNAKEKKNHGIFGLAGECILTQAHGKIQSYIGMVTSGRHDLVHSQL